MSVSRVIKASAGLLVILIAIWLVLARSESSENTTEIKSPVSAIPPEVYESPTVEKLFELTNAERIKVGVAPLVLNPLLNQSAQDKCNDMTERKYFAHNTPDGQEPWVFIDRYLWFTRAGENLAEIYTTSEAVVGAWMNSPDHKANILDASFTDVGFGICESEYIDPTLYRVVQHLIQR